MDIDERVRKVHLYFKKLIKNMEILESKGYDMDIFKVYVTEITDIVDPSSSDDDDSTPWFK
jgi:hypothetical protein